jgi:hypothetical protein
VGKYSILCCDTEITVEGIHGHAGSAYGVVMKLLRGLEEKGHCVVMDYLFLFHTTF